MPSGKTHDCITLWSLPFVASVTFGLTKNGNLTLIVSGAFLFSGLMFGPDLDLHSLPYMRWGPLRWIWIPYQKTLRHRSLWSHGLIVGTTLRLLYLASWLGVLGVSTLGIVQVVWSVEWNWYLLAQWIKVSTQYKTEWIALYLGLELGAMSHSVSDWGSSVYKRFNKHKEDVLPRTKMKKRKSTAGVSHRSKLIKVKSRRKQ